MGRSYVRGENHGRAALADDDIIPIREAYARRELSQYGLAVRYGVEQATIGAIVRGKTWRHIGGPITHRGRSGEAGR